METAKREWKKPAFEVIDVGAEVTAYVYTDEDDDQEIAPEERSDQLIVQL